MKIAQICPYDWSRPGGVKTHIESLTEQLRQMGHEVMVIAPKVHAERVDDERVKLVGQGMSIHFWGGTQIDISLARGQEVEELKKFLQREQFDLLHFHTAWTPFMTYQVRYYSKAKHVGTFHDTPADNFFAQKVVGGVLMPLAASLVWRFADQMISVSKTQAKYVRSFLAKDPVIIPNGIDLSRFNTGFAPLDTYQDGKFNLLFLGRFEERKGLLYALHAFKYLKEKHPNVRLLVAGDGEQRQEALDLVSSHQLADVIFLGFVTEEMKTRLIRTADLMLATAIYGESFGIVLLEAMACGTPMAGFGNEGYLNVVTPPWDEYFPEPRNQHALNAAVEKLYEDEGIRNAMSTWGIAEAQQYDWRLISQRVFEVYQSAMPSC